MGQRISAWQDFNGTPEQLAELEKVCNEDGGFQLNNTYPPLWLRNTTCPMVVISLKTARKYRILTK